MSLATRTPPEEGLLVRLAMWYSPPRVSSDGEGFGVDEHGFAARLRVCGKPDRWRHVASITRGTRYEPVG